MEIKNKFNLCVEELEINAGDYQFRMKLKGINKYFHQFLMLEFKQYIKQRFTNYCGELKINYTGNCYETRWVSNLYPKIFYHITEEDKKTNCSSIAYKFLTIGRSNVRQLYKEVPAYREEILKLFNKITEGRPPTDDEIYKLAFREEIKTKLCNLSDKKNKFNYLKYKVCVKKMNYEKSVITWSSVLNIKKYDRKTKKTSNRDLKATDIWSDYNDKPTWRFGGLKVDVLRMLCVENGYDKKKANSSQYGDLAEWYMKL